MSSQSIVSKRNPEQNLQAVLVKLLQGFIFQEEKKYWEKLLTYQEQVRHYFVSLGLQLVINQEDGYAFLKGITTPLQQEEILDDNHSEEEEGDHDDELSVHKPRSSEGQAYSRGGIPTLVRRMPLSFDVSLLIILLRESLEQFDQKVSDDYRLILGRNDLYEMLKTFYPAKNDETALMKKFEIMISKVEELGFISELKNNKGNYEVRRVIKAFFDANKLREIKEKMMLHLSSRESEVV